MRSVSKAAGGASWQLEDAKNRLSEVIRRALNEGPQTIRVGGVDTVIVTPIRKKRRRKPRNLYELFKPLRSTDLKMGRRND